MARLSGFVILEEPQHVILRGNNRAEIFQLQVYTSLTFRSNGLRYGI
jgi:hypothetical protein